MAAAFELRGKEGLHDLLVNLKIDEPPREAHHVAVVVLAEELSERRGGDRRRAHAGHLIRSDGHADARAANEHAEICLTGGDGMRDLEDSVVYAEPEDYFNEYGDSSVSGMPADGEFYTGSEHEGDVDEFEVVTGPE